MGIKFASRKLFKQYHPEGTEDFDEWRHKFVEACDPTEYAGAIALLGSWKEWQLFKKSWPYFTENILPEWLAEIDVKLASMAINRLKENKDAGAQRWLAERKYKIKKRNPSKAETERENRIQQHIDNEIQDDAARVLGSNAIN